ncbi:PREDICTED: heparan-sulfate 6-O-sulfotransferase 2 isoform X1 [Nicrophorus vespilloides]|uniref:Heparan-sulfate 6-O-sulfotransferase n=2 Tax=Nicrophorus vespilloides TaxID=110193 RepID=A0ABM1MGY5_NICVS|nr:PREDICTED: heparan-sulfate 6-O-sulfotransferase 2 isoform X1 [Nicrophorus vespilloides]
MKNFKSVSVQVIDSDIALLLPNGVYEIKQMEPRSRLKSILIICGAMALFGIFGFGYFCPDKVCALSNRDAVRFDSSQVTAVNDGMGKPLSATNSKTGLSYDDMLNDDFAFDMDSHDVMVFLHMQKTGGTSFGKHLVHDLDLQRPCTCPITPKRCYCFRPHSNQSWLFSRYTTGWKCGLHADWTELTNCVDAKLDELEGHIAKRRYFYITLLRQPLARYLSEFRHVQRGATWKGSRHFCHNRAATEVELPACYKSESWDNVELDDFMNCDSNLAINRQTRMLADLELVGCYNKDYMPEADRNRVMLASAKKNLQSMAFFGLTEYQKISQYIFEETFNLRFAIPFEQNNATVSSHTMPTLSAEQATKIAHLNDLDNELYQFAKQLLFERFHRLKARDSKFEQRFSHLGEIPGKFGVTEFDWDKLDDDITSNPV